MTTILQNYKVSAKWLFVVMIILGLAACGSVNTYVEQKEAYAKLEFRGNLDDVTVAISGLGEFNLLEYAGARRGSKVARIEIKPGTYQVRATRNGQLLVNRNIFLSNRDIREVSIP